MVIIGNIMVIIGNNNAIFTSHFPWNGLSIPPIKMAMTGGWIMTWF